MSSDAPSRSGFSLLELLVSLALLALIGAGLAGGFGLATQVWKRSQALSEHVSEIAMRTQLRHFLSQAAPPNRLSPFDMRFLGQEARFSFVTLAETPSVSNAAATRMTLRTEKSKLIVSTEFLDDNTAVIHQFEDVLARNADEVVIDYLDHDGNWLKRWEKATKLPKLVRIRMDEGSVPPWPEFTVRLFLQ